MKIDFFVLNTSDIFYRKDITRPWLDYSGETSSYSLKPFNLYYYNNYHPCSLFVALLAVEGHFLYGRELYLANTFHPQYQHFIIVIIIMVIIIIIIIVIIIIIIMVIIIIIIIIMVIIIIIIFIVIFFGV